ncbi:MAG: PEGA domain-containing protein [Proteobacteria bacterium]|nr:PEGA domain-containing protein [Pseudomonadota bacterium]MCP4920446.1 PEGA domain-containing protein [Pseudomonadota bacterium]
MFLALISTSFAGDLRIDSSGSFVVVSLDGKLVGTTPLELPKVEAGSHELGFWASATDAEPVFTETVEVPETGAVFATVDFVTQAVTFTDAVEPVAPVVAEPSSDGGRPVGRLIGASGIAVAGVGLGAAASVQYLGAREAYVRFLDVSSDQVAQSIWDDEVRPAKVRAGALGVAGAVAVAGGIGLFVSTDVVVVPGPGGLVVSGSF